MTMFLIKPISLIYGINDFIIRATLMVDQQKQDHLYHKYQDSLLGAGNEHAKK